MNKEEIKEILLARGYSNQGAETASSDLTGINEKLQDCLDSWLSSGVETDYVVDEFSIKELMRKYGYKYPAALLGINWILDDPETAKSVIRKGLR